MVAKVNDLDVFVRFLAGVDGVWVLDGDGEALGDGVQVRFCVEAGMLWMDIEVGVCVEVEGRVVEAAASSDASA